MVLVRRIGSSGSDSRSSQLSGLLVAATKRVVPITITLAACLLVVAFYALGIGNAGDAASTTGVIDAAGSSDELTEDLIAWLRSNGAFIDARLSIRRVDGIRGIFADDAFEAKEIIFTIPLELIHDGVPRKIKNNGRQKWRDGHSDCGTTYEIHDAMTRRNGTNPYGRYLARQPRRYVPGYWTEDGRELLGEILGEHLPPQRAKQDAVRKDWLNYCKGATADEWEVHASQLVVARADGSLMVPFYDMINHRNGHWYNAQHYGSRKQGFSLVTNRRVEAGEQLYCSYNTCTICGSRMDKWGTPEMLRDYGFVEPFPQRYVLEAARLKFGLDEAKEGAGLVVKWYVPPSQRGLDFLRSELDRLRRVLAMKGSTNRRSEGRGEILESEWKTIWTFHDALVVAFTAALAQAPAVSEEVWSMGENQWYKDMSREWPPNRFY